MRISVLINLRSYSWSRQKSLSLLTDKDNLFIRDYKTGRRREPVLNSPQFIAQYFTSFSEDPVMKEIEKVRTE